jgi:hypothetical protein
MHQHRFEWMLQLRETGNRAGIACVASGTGAADV